MKLWACLLLFGVSAATPELRYFKYDRAVPGTPSVGSQACLSLDAEIFAHAAQRLTDLRLYRETTETPYIIRLSAPVQIAAAAIKPLNPGLQGRQTVFDAAMPEGSYSDLSLGVAAQNFIATATVYGREIQAGGVETKLGDYTLFDLTRQRLGRSTVIHLPESNFRYLHFQIAGPIAPEDITSLTVERRPTDQPRYQPVAQLSQVAQLSPVSEKNHATVFEVTVPAHVPVDRLVVVPGPEPAIFSRDVRIAVEPIPARPTNSEAEPSGEPSTATGNLLRLHSTQDGHRIDEERLGIDTPLVDFDSPAKWTISIENGDDPPLTVASIHLQMLERDLCFEAAGGALYTLFYGDTAIAAPLYDYSALFRLQANGARATAGPEQRNPIYQPRPDDRPFTDKHPALLWVALLAVIALLGGIALRSSSRTGGSSGPTVTPG